MAFDNDTRKTGEKVDGMAIEHIEKLRPILSIVLSAQIPRFGKSSETAVISFFYVIGETTARQLFVAQMIAKAVATKAFPVTTRITTVTVFKI